MSQGAHSVVHGVIDVVHVGHDVVHGELYVSHVGHSVVHGELDVWHVVHDVVHGVFDAAHVAHDVVHGRFDVVHFGFVTRNGPDAERRSISSSPPSSPSQKAVCSPLSDGVVIARAIGASRVTQMNTHNIQRSIVALALPRRVAALIAVAKAIVQGLTGNPSFPQPDPSLPVLSTAIADLEAAELAVQTRAKGAVATRDQKRAALIVLLRREKLYVQKIADSDYEKAPALIQSAGMGVAKSKVHGKRVFAVKQGRLSGTVSVATAFAGPRSAYEWEFSSDGGKTWQAGPPTTRTKTTLLGLQPGTTYAFRSRSVTKVGPSDWTQPLTLVVN